VSEVDAERDREEQGEESVLEGEGERSINRVLGSEINRAVVRNQAAEARNHAAGGG